jgi:uncharacterized protein
MKIILSIDGGGIRGVTSAVILEYIEKKMQEISGDDRTRLANYVDLVSGTSTGSIIGSLMLLPKINSPIGAPLYSMTDIVDLYIKLGPEVFKKSFWHNIKTLWGVLGPKFPDRNIDSQLLQIFGHHKLRDLIKPCAFTGYDINTRRVHIYTNQDRTHKYGNYYVKDIVRGSTAIPAYFTPAHFREGREINTIVDGGVFANNPAMVAYIEASKYLYGSNEIPANIDPHQMIILSIGTGRAKRKEYAYKKASRWGAAQWFFPVLDVLLSSSSDIVDYQMQKLFQAYGRPDNYKRINPLLNFSQRPSTDGSSENIVDLIKDAQTYIQINRTLLNTIAHEICDINNLKNYGDSAK